jgi:hypothetical protein
MSSEFLSRLPTESERSDAKQSRLARPHSKSNIVGDSVQFHPERPVSYAAEIHRLTERRAILDKAIEDATARNQVLLAAAKRRAALLAEYEEEKSMTTFLTIILDAAEQPIIGPILPTGG